MAVEFRQAGDDDVAAMTQIRARYSYDEEYWSTRIGGYLKGMYSPQQALEARAAFLAIDGDSVVGFVAGHRTKRFGCDGELEWIDVVAERRGIGIADGLMQAMAAWFIEQGAVRVCVNVAHDNEAALRFYARLGATVLNEHFMIWEDFETAICSSLK